MRRHPKQSATDDFRVEFLQVGTLPDPVVSFWKTTVREQDPISAPFRGPEWFDFMTGGEGNGQVAALFREDSPIALLPLLEGDWVAPLRLRGHLVLNRRFRVLRACGGDIVSGHIVPSEINTLLHAVLERHKAVHGIFFDHVSSDSPLCSASTLSVSGEMVHHRLHLPPSRYEFRKLRSSKSRQKLKGRKRALERAVGEELSVVEIRTQEEWRAHADEVNAVIQKSWQARDLGRCRIGGSYATLAQRGWLRFFLLRSPRMGVAVAECFQVGDTLLYETIGYDPDISKYSPGTILLYELVERLYDDNTPAFVDFGEGEALYKRQLANDELTISQQMCLRPFSAAHVYVRLYRLVSFLLNVVRR